DVIVIDPLYSTHDQDENDTRAMAALCQALVRLRDSSKAALIVVHHIRKSAGRHELGSAFRGSSALHAVGDSYLLLARPSPQIPTVELRFQFRYAAAPPSRLLSLDPDALWFSASGSTAPASAPSRRRLQSGGDFLLSPFVPNQQPGQLGAEAFGYPNATSARRLSGRSFLTSSPSRNISVRPQCGMGYPSCLHKLCILSFACLGFSPFDCDQCEIIEEIYQQSIGAEESDSLQYGLRSKLPARP